MTETRKHGNKSGTTDIGDYVNSILDFQYFFQIFKLKKEIVTLTFCSQVSNLPHTILLFKNDLQYFESIEFIYEEIGCSIFE